MSHPFTPGQRVIGVNPDTNQYEQGVVVFTDIKHGEEYIAVRYDSVPEGYFEAYYPRTDYNGVRGYAIRPVYTIAG